MHRNEAVQERTRIGNLGKSKYIYIYTIYVYVYTIYVCIRSVERLCVLHIHADGNGGCSRGMLERGWCHLHACEIHLTLEMEDAREMVWLEHGKNCV